MANAYETYDLGNVLLQSGMTLRNAKIAYKTYGELNSSRSNAIVYPSWYSSHISENEWLIGKGMGLDPAKYFIIVPALFGNGESSSPSNTSKPCNGPRFPAITLYDDVSCQHRLVTERFHIEHLKMVLGWSMGAAQTYQWGVQYPDFMDALLPFCGSSNCAPHNFVFLEAVKAAITTDAAWNGGWYKEQPWAGLRAAARVYAGWGFSQAFYWEEEWRKMGYTSLEDFLVSFWEAFFLNGRDANNLLTELSTWQHADVGLTPGFGGDTKKALGAIRARIIQMPGSTDLYFQEADEKWASQFIRKTEVRPIPSIWGHFAGAGVNPVDTKFIDDAVKELLR